ncbi:MAG: radical SAM protein [Desulfobacula sp.]|jgi:MoaA/NifB/PqqE/SkfB family radical SAM enzyme|nr:radical SAM protein [Desulfobacula sp.]
MNEPELLNCINSSFKIRFSPAGVYAFNRKTGVNILFDQTIPLKKQWANAPRQVSIALTNKCDLNCPHCYSPKNPGMISFDILTDWLLELDANGCIGVGLGGGEPTLYPHLLELCSFAAKKTKLAIIMTTHGHLLSDHLLHELKDKINFIRVSMDGVGPTYEKSRGRPFTFLLERLRSLRGKIKFGINYLVNATTINDIDEAICLASDYGATEFLLIPEVPVGRGKGIDDETVVKLQDWVKYYQGDVPLSVSRGGSEGLPACDPFSSETELEAFAHIDAQGVIKRTSYDKKGIKVYDDGIISALNMLKKIDTRGV